MFGFRPNAMGGDVWGSLRIGFNSNPVDFIENVSQEANMRKFWVRKAPLQAADTDYAGWLYLSPEALHPEETADSINEYITNVSNKRKSTPFPIACERRMIWDDKKKAKDLTIKEKVAKKALHILCEKGRVPDTIMFVRTWLKSKRFARFSNLPMKFVPNFERGNGKVYNEKFGRAVNKHMQLTTLGTQSMTSSDFCSVDHANELLPNEPTLREVLMEMKVRPPALSPPGAFGPHQKTGPLFLSFDPAQRSSDRGSYVLTYTVDNASEAEEKVKNLLSYLTRSYGDSVMYWFTAAAIERAEHMKWDDVNDRPITREEMDLDDLLDDDMDWVANMDDVALSFGAKTEIDISLVRPSLSSKVSNNPLAGETDSVRTFYVVNDLPANEDGDTGANRDAGSVDTTSVAGGPEGSPADAV
jgi:hypothetical protein